MTTYYVDPTAATNGSGTLASPFNDWSGVTWAAGNSYLQRAGTTYNGRVTAGASGTAASPIVIGVYNPVDGTQVSTTAGAATVTANGDGSAPAITTSTRSYVSVVGFTATNAGAAQPLINVGTANGDGCFASYCVANSSLAGGIVSACQIGPVGGGVSYCTANNNATTGISLQGNTDYVNAVCNYNTANANGAHGIQWGPFTADKYLRGASSFSYNTCVGNATVGLRLIGDVLSCAVGWNTCQQNLIGLYVGCIASSPNRYNFSVVSHNTCTNNVQFGIQTSQSVGWLITRNNCSYNGANTGSRYGHGIEIFSSSATYPTSGVVCFNTCVGNYNYGGTVPNGTEGIGIGLDNNHVNVLCYGNLLVSNEGSGIAVNAGVGNSVVCGNLLINNYCVSAARCSASWPAYSYVQGQLYTGPTENGLTISNNTFINLGAAACNFELGEHSSAAGTGTIYVNNLFIGAAIAMKVRNGVTRTNNAFWNCAINVQDNGSTNALTNGTGAVTTNPTLDNNYQPIVGSPLINTGTFLSWLRDLRGNLYGSPPSIGAYEYFSRSSATIARTAIATARATASARTAA